MFTVITGVEWIYLKTGMAMLPGGRYVAAVLNVVTASAIPLCYIARRITFSYSKIVLRETIENI